MRTRGIVGCAIALSLLGIGLLGLACDDVFSSLPVRTQPLLELDPAFVAPGERYLLQIKVDLPGSYVYLATTNMNGTDTGDAAGLLLQNGSLGSCNDPQTAMLDGRYAFCADLIVSEDAAVGVRAVTMEFVADDEVVTARGVITVNAQ